MRLSSVRSLKLELFELPAPVVARVAASTAFATFASSRAVQRTMDGIALGVAPAGRSDYRLAVRLQRTGPLVRAMAEEIVTRARGEADVQVIGTISKFSGSTTAAFYQARRRPLRIGSSIGDVPPAGFVAAGTLGCFVARRAAPHYLGVLTNNHVIAGENANRIGSPIAQPGTLDGGRFPAGEIGELGRRVRLVRGKANRVDAAVGDLYEGVPFDASRVGSLGRLAGTGRVYDLDRGATLHKVGRTTGQTRGRLTAFDVDNVRVEYDLGVLRFDDQIEIEGTGRRAFSQSGDSGSLIVDGGLRAVGLLFAGGDVGGSNGKGLTYANPIGTVLSALAVDLET